MTQPKKRIHRGFIWAWRLLIAAVLFFNVRLYSPSPLAERQDSEPLALVAQLAANRAALDAGSPSQMQHLFPEGYYFSYLFHGLTWVELAMRDDLYTQRAVEECSWCLSHLESQEAREPFPPGLPPDHGMFYSAWKCSLRAGMVVLQGGDDPVQLREFRRECDAIVMALGEAETPFLPSYGNPTWPCDAVPAVHAMSVHDRFFQEERYQTVIAKWLEDSRDRLDPETDLLPHTAQLPDGREVSVARATSQVIMLRYLPDIDASFATDQYERFRERFFISFLGAPCVLEYPSGVTGFGDVDSGPLIFGRSLSATVLMMGVAQIYGDHSMADAIAQVGETVGLPWTLDGQKRYVGGVLPIGDIMVSYAHVARPWFAGNEHHPVAEYSVPVYWRWQLHALSLLVFLPVLFPFFGRRVGAKLRSIRPGLVC